MAPTVGAFFQLLKHFIFLLLYPNMVIIGGDRVGGGDERAIRHQQLWREPQHPGDQHPRRLPILRLLLGVPLWEAGARGSATCSGPNCFEKTFIVYYSSDNQMFI